MKTKKIFSLLAVLALGLAMVGLASAAEELDQSQTTSTCDYPVGERAWIAQTFTAGKTGPLTKVVLKTGYVSPDDDSGDLTVELRNAIGSAPGSTIYASTNMMVSSDSENEFIFSTTYDVTSGTKYTIVIHETNLEDEDFSHAAYLWADRNNLYTDGQLFPGNWGYLWNDNEAWGNADLYFKTYVGVTTPEPIPEFSTIAIPVATILGLLFLFSQRRKKET